jgi:hypothetical protein
MMMWFPSDHEVYRPSLKAVVVVLSATAVLVLLALASSL